MADPVDKARLERLEKRIGALKAASTPRPEIEQHHAQAQLAWRMVIELVTGLGIGFGIGYWVDVLLGTLPIFLVLFVLLGLAAGVRVMLRTAREVQAGETGAGRDRDGD